MADGDSSDLNNTIRELIGELKGQKEEISSLRNEVRGQSVNVSSEVKKLKTETETKWKREGNKIQYNFNAELSDTLKQASWALSNKKPEYVLEILEDGIESIKKRNKLIRIADTSDCGWETVKQYQSNPVASDSEDESRIAKAESKALKRKKNKQAESSKNSRFGKPNPYAGNVPNYVQPTRSLFGSRSTQQQSFRPYRGEAFQPKVGACFACGEFSHYRRDCPNVRPDRYANKSESKM